MNALKRKSRSRKSARTNVQVIQPQPVNPILITLTEASGNVLTLTFDQVVRLGGTPNYTTQNALEVQSAVQVAPNQVAITFNGLASEITSLDVGYRDPAIRSASGGYVVSRTFALAA